MVTKVTWWNLAGIPLVVPRDSLIGVSFFMPESVELAGIEPATVG